MGDAARSVRLGIDTLPDGRSSLARRVLARADEVHQQVGTMEAERRREAARAAALEAARAAALERKAGGSSDGVPPAARRRARATEPKLSAAELVAANQEASRRIAAQKGRLASRDRQLADEKRHMALAKKERADAHANRRLPPRPPAVDQDQENQMMQLTAMRLELERTASEMSHLRAMEAVLTRQLAMPAPQPRRKEPARP